MLKKAGIAITRALIIFLIATLVFSAAVVEFPSLLKGVAGDIFSYANPETQEKLAAMLVNTCSSLVSGNSVTLSELCTNATLLESVRKNCAEFRQLKLAGYKIDNEEQLSDTCNRVESGDMEKSCSEAAPQRGEFSEICKQYNAGRIDNRGLFESLLIKSLEKQKTQINWLSFEGFINLLNYLHNKMTTFVILIPLIIILYFLLGGTNAFLREISKIFVNVGILILLPYIIIIAYDKLVGIDTTPFLNQIFGIETAKLGGIISLVMLMFLRTYTPFILAVGLILLVFGFAGKFYFKENAEMN